MGYYKYTTRTISSTKVHQVHVETLCTSVWTALFQSSSVFVLIYKSISLLLLNLLAEKPRLNSMWNDFFRICI